jgi:hypothetical protein
MAIQSRIDAVIKWVGFAIGPLGGAYQCEGYRGILNIGVWRVFWRTAHLQYLLYVWSYYIQ